MSLAMETRHDPQRDALRRRTVLWVVGLATMGLIFDGYDLVVYGAVVSIFLRNPGAIGQVTPATAGAGQLCADRRAGGRPAGRRCR
jgi:AAHS family benzoate transporter-like MFS transporter